MTGHFVLDLSEISLPDVPRVGGKNASLDGELYRALKPKGVGVLDGFATTADAYRRLLAIEVKASRRVDARNLKGFEALAERARKLTRRIVVFLGKRSQRINGIEALPIDDFLAALPS